MKGKAKLRRPRKKPREFEANLELLQDQRHGQTNEDNREMQRNKRYNRQEEMEEEKGDSDNG